MTLSIMAYSVMLVSFMMSVIYDECHLWRVSFMMSVTKRPFIPSVVMLNVVAPLKQLSSKFVDFSLVSSGQTGAAASRPSSSSSWSPTTSSSTWSPWPSFSSSSYTLASRNQCYKTFYSCNLWILVIKPVFFLGKPFHPSLMFMGKAMSLPYSGAPLR
jgi:hypothetical protein